MSICVMLSNISNSGGNQMLAVCMTLIDNDKDQTSFEDFYYRNRQIAYALHTRSWIILRWQKRLVQMLFSASQNVLKKFTIILCTIWTHILLELLETPVMRSTIRKIKIQHRLYMILRWKMSRVRILWWYWLRSAYRCGKKAGW